MHLKLSFGYLKLAQQYNIPVVPIVCTEEYNCIQKWGKLPWETFLANHNVWPTPLFKTWIPRNLDKPVSISFGSPIYPSSSLSQFQQSVFQEIQSLVEQQGYTCSFVI
jgi:1-acyl-sn-glycerol-3-phosphate acyltransferase